MNKEIKQTDIVIVGAGPSGCMAANILVDSGRSVILLDKNDFPRHKPCAGGLTPKTVEELPFEITDLKQHDSETMLFKFTNGKTVDLNNESGACKMVVREEFDEFFFNYVVGKGVECVRGKVLKIDENTDKVSVETSEYKIKCNFLIGADGANSTVRRLTTDLILNYTVFAFDLLVDRNI
jgi:flavin-dependent dehydrogenase